MQLSKSSNFYHVDLGSIICNCANSPHICLCKHNIAIDYFFRGANLGPQPFSNASELDIGMGTLILPVQQDGSIHSTDDSTSFNLAANGIISLTQELLSKAPHDPEITKSLKFVESRLRTLVLLLATAAGDGSHLSEKEKIGPNQCSWPETARQMGVKCAAEKVKLIACLQPSTLASQIVSVLPIVTHTELESNPANMQSLMHNQLPPMLEHAQPLNGGSPRQILHTCPCPPPCLRSPLWHHSPCLHCFPSPHHPHAPCSLYTHQLCIIPIVPISLRPLCLSPCISNTFISQSISSIPNLRGHLHIIPRSHFRWLTPITCNLV